MRSNTGLKEPGLVQGLPHPHGTCQPCIKRSSPVRYWCHCVWLYWQNGSVLVAVTRRIRILLLVLMTLIRSCAVPMKWI